MKAVSSFRKPKRNEKRLLRCGKCGKVFEGIKLPFFTKCPRCGGRKVVEDNRIRY
jgi:DNA-directed RNA polymerase subunit RPC12/RpoP